MVHGASGQMYRMKINIAPESPGLRINTLFPTFTVRTGNPFDMVPDYPHKIFSDQRNRYCLLMEVLAID